MALRSAPPLYRFARRMAGSGDELSAVLFFAAPGDVIAFSGGFPAPETFPTEELAALTNEALLADAPVALQYTPTEGLPSLRSTLREWILASQGTEPEPGGLMVTSGGIEALSLLARCLVEPGDRVLVEAPTYVGAITAFTGFEAAVEGVPTDADGIDPDALVAAIGRGERPKLLYVIPDFQNPTGHWTSTDRRRAVIDICRRYGVPLVEDVAYRELAFEPAEQRPSLWSLGPDVVVQVGTFAKIFFPGVRLGWAAAAPELIGAMVQTKQNSDQCASGLGQWLVQRYLAAGSLEPRLEEARRLYAQRAWEMDAALSRHVPEGCTWTRPQGGFFTWVTAPEGVDTTALAPRAVARKVAYLPGAAFYPDRSDTRRLRLSFSRVTTEQIHEGIAALGEVLASATPGSLR